MYFVKEYELHRDRRGSAPTIFLIKSDTGGVDQARVSNNGYATCGVNHSNKIVASNQFYTFLGLAKGYIRNVTKSEGATFAEGSSINFIKRLR